jgi:hypothetical protein
VQHGEVAVQYPLTITDNNRGATLLRVALPSLHRRTCLESTVSLPFPLK